MTDISVKLTKQSSSMDNLQHKCDRRINIKFENLIYRVKENVIWNRSTKTILNGINGEFRAGELTAIMGASGAGKSTLLNILTGFTTNSASGTITVNGTSRDLNRFRSQAVYIMQNCQLQMLLTVSEAMVFAANLKIGRQFTCAEKKERINSIVESIGLYQHRHTRTDKLSGGERKRLAIAIELVENPQFMAFDEPTSGLDSSTSRNLILLLKQLAREGRTIVCTIHQPPALSIGLFDHLYAMADGKCIYAGATGMLVPFLDDLGLICPKTYDPFDYLLEISTNDYGPHNDRLVEKIQNGQNEMFRLRARNGTMYDTCLKSEQIPGIIAQQQQQPYCNGNDSNGHNEMYATSFYRQWYLLTIRMIRCLSRDRFMCLIRLTVTVCVALMYGGLYHNIGDDAALISNNHRYIFTTLLFFMNVPFYSMIFWFPIEMPIVAREHFNRWYSAKAYYFALTFADLPLQLVCVLIYIGITYVMTGQPLESYRFIYFLVLVTLLALVSQSMGMIVGAAFEFKLAGFIGSNLQGFLMLFSGFFVHLTDALPVLHWLFHLSFLRYVFEGCIDSIYGHNRPKLQCNEIYCHYQWPSKFIKEFDMHRNDFYSAFVILSITLVCFRAIAFVVIAWRLKRK